MAPERVSEVGVVDFLARVWFAQVICVVPFGSRNSFRLYKGALKDVTINK